MKLTKALWVVIAGAAMLFFFTACPAEGEVGGVYVPVTGISLDKSGELTIAVGGSVELNGTITPSNASDERIIWKSVYPKCAMVFPNGKSATVYGLMPGKTTILAVTEDGAQFASVTVIVE